MTDFFERFESQLRAAASAELASTGTGAGAPGRNWTLAALSLRRPAVLLASLIAVLVAVGVAAFGLSLAGRHHPSVSAKPPGGAPNLVNAAWNRVDRNDPACLPRRIPKHPRPLSGAPSSDLLSVYALLRRPKRPSDVLPSVRLGLGNLVSVYSNYVRLARMFDRTSYYLVPFGLPGAIPQRCFVEVRAMLNRSFNAQSPRVRTQILAYERQLPRPSKGPLCLVAVADSPHALFGGYECTFNGTSPMLGVHGQLVYGPVPDGVATVTLRYPKKGSVTVRPTNNVLVVVLRPPLTWLPRTVVWRSSTGATIKSFQVAPKARANWYGVSMAAG